MVAFPLRRTVDPEWAPLSSLWTVWPSHAELWQEDLTPARRELAQLVRALAAHVPVCVLACGAGALASARRALAAPGVTILQAQFGDIWLRDTGPVFVREDGQSVALGFAWNGWGGKYLLDHDADVAALVADHLGLPLRRDDFVLEGGSVEFDGAGRLMVTRQCLLNPNRNPHLSAEQLQDKLVKAFGLAQVLWLGEGLVGDHTDGHIDNLARWVAPGRAVVQQATGQGDPNGRAYDLAAEALRDQGVEVARIPSPGLVLGADGEPAPASHLNYVVANGVVVVPAYHPGRAAQAVRALQPLLPQHRVMALPAWHLLTGGGSFHCMTLGIPR